MPLKHLGKYPPAAEGVGAVELVERGRRKLRLGELDPSLEHEPGVPARCRARVARRTGLGEEKAERERVGERERWKLVRGVECELGVALAQSRWKRA